MRKLPVCMLARMRHIMPTKPHGRAVTGQWQGNDRAMEGQWPGPEAGGVAGQWQGQWQAVAVSFREHQRGLQEQQHDHEALQQLHCVWQQFAYPRITDLASGGCQGNISCNAPGTITTALSDSLWSRVT